METYKNIDILINTTENKDIILKDNIDTNKIVENMNLSPDNSYVNIKYTDWTTDLLSQNSIEYQILTWKIQKREEIIKIASITDQINLMAGVLAKYVLDIPEDQRSETQIKALNAYTEIQAILNS